jgi:hypothetical protein
VLVTVNTVDALVVAWRRCAFFKFMTSHAERAGFFRFTVASSMVVPATSETSIYGYIIFHVADMPAYFQFSFENLSRLRSYFYYKVSSVSFASKYEFWLYVPCIEI